MSTSIKSKENLHMGCLYFSPQTFRSLILHGSGVFLSYFPPHFTSLQSSSGHTADSARESRGQRDILPAAATADYMYYIAAIVVHVRKARVNQYTDQLGSQAGDPPTPLLDVRPYGQGLSS